MGYLKSYLGIEMNIIPMVLKTRVPINDHFMAYPLSPLMVRMYKSLSGVHGHFVNVCLNEMLGLPEGF